MTARLELRDLTVCYRAQEQRGRLVAVDGVDLQVAAGEAVGILGESGCGKSSLVGAAFGLSPASAEVRGEVWLDGARVDGLDERGWRRVRGRRVGLVFQQPSLALHPLRSVGGQLLDVLRLHRPGRREALEARARELFAELDLAPEHLEARPHQLSGGQRQRACLALALAGEPSLLVADEPTTALDSETETRVLDLVEGLRRRRQLSLLWISHDPAVLERLCDRLYVMYAGCFIEAGPAVPLLVAPRHPYFGALLACRPRSNPPPGTALRERRLATIAGDPPDPRRLGEGCRFAPRCARRVADCEVSPAAKAGDGRTVWCWRPLPGPAP